jgi:ABC-type transport system substrate-binding protein
VDEARRLLAEAGYPGGRDAKSGEPLVVYLDTTGSGMGDKSTVDWLAKQFRKLDVQLVVRATDYNRFQDKIRKGNAQLFTGAGTPTTPTRRTSCSCSTAPRAR